MNALTLSSTNFVSSRLTDHGEEERRHDLALEGSRGQAMNGIRIE